MPPTLPMDLSSFPALRTRKALVVLDFQNEFLSPRATLPVTEPTGFVDRTIDVARAFRESGAGDIFWICSEFDAHRPAADAHIITSDKMLNPSRSRRPPVEASQESQDGDDEAFLSVGGPASEALRQQLLPGNTGSGLFQAAAETMVPKKDFVLAKSHYSAFETTQLLMRLRTHFITELYICGALTNISVYATALDAASHGVALTVIDDCCGYRSAVRHTNALQSLVQLTGCDVQPANAVIETLTPAAGGASDAHTQGGGAVSAIAASLAAAPVASSRGGAQKTRRSATRQAAHGPVAIGDSASSLSAAGSSGAGGSLPVRTKNPEPQAEAGGASEFSFKPGTQSSSTSPHSENRTLSTAPPAATKPVPKAQPETAQPLQPLVADDAKSAQATEPPGAAAGATALSPPVLEACEAPDEVDESQPSLSAADLLLVSMKKKRAESSRRRSKRRTESPRDTPEPEEDQAKPDREPGDCEPAPTTQPKAMAPAAPTQPAEPAEPAVAVAKNDIAPHHDDDWHSAPLADVDATKQPAATDPLCEGDTIVYHDILPASVEEGIYERLKDEVQWLHMSHQGGEVPRLVCVQGAVDDDGTLPIYRHPADESPPLEPFTPTVLQIKERVETIVGHPLNHALIQLYRTGNDYISEHSDKTLDIVQGSYICNVSLGAERTMVFRTKRVDKDPSRDVEASEVQAGAEATKTDKTEGTTTDKVEGTKTDKVEEHKAGPKKRQTIRAQLPHNSLCRMGLQTNMRWLHAIRRDKREERAKTPAELAFGGGRISLTFRQIGTFLNRDQTRIWGQGAVAKTRDSARPVVNGQSDEAIGMLKAFGTENHSSNFDWEKHYSQGFDVLHMSTSPRFFASADPLANLSIQLLLSELGIAYARGSLSGPADAKAEASMEAGTIEPSSLDLAVRFADNDHDHSVVDGIMAIMLYLDTVRGGSKHLASAQPEAARILTRFQQALCLQDKMRASRHASTDADALLKHMKAELATWNGYASAAGAALFIAGGSTVSLADFAFWPVLHHVAQTCGSEEDLASKLAHAGLDNLAKYYSKLKERGSVQRVCTPDAK